MENNEIEEILALENISSHKASVDDFSSIINNFDFDSEKVEIEEDTEFSFEKNEGGEEKKESEKENSDNQKNPEDEKTIGSFISPDIVINVFDIVFSRVATIGVIKVGKIEAQVNDFKLSAQEKTALKPCVKEILEELDIQVESPWTKLAILLVAIYSAKLIEVIPSNREALVNNKPKTRAAKSTGGSAYTPKWKRDENGKLLKDSKGNKIPTDKYAKQL